MTEVTTACPQCGQDNAISFYEGTENGAPHGAGYWPMQVSDAFQECSCELSDADWELARLKSGRDADLDQATHERDTLVKAIRYAVTLPPAECWANLVNMLHNWDEDWPDDG